MWQPEPSETAQLEYQMPSIKPKSQTNPPPPTHTHTPRTPVLCFLRLRPYIQDSAAFPFQLCTLHTHTHQIKFPSVALPSTHAMQDIRKVAVLDQCRITYHRYNTESIAWSHHVLVEPFCTTHSTRSTIVNIVMRRQQCIC